MGPTWGPSFLVALSLATCVTPFLRRLALSTGFVDRPGGHKSHDRPVPYLGGLALIVGVLAGMVAGPRVENHAIAIAVGAGILGTVGLIDDHRSVEPTTRLLLQLTTASLAVLLGLRVSVTGILAIDAAITLVWIVGITNAFNLLDNMDGLAAGVAAVVGIGVLGAAILGGQTATAVAAAALVGACLGFLAYNRRPASIFMGDTGSLFLGFVIATLTIEVDPSLAPPASFVIPVLLLGLPVLDTATVTLGRLRRRRSVFRGGKDHLSHRLVALRISPGAAVGVLVGVQALVSAVAVAAARTVIPVWVAAVTVTLVLAVLSVVTARASVYNESTAGRHRTVALAVLGAAGILLLLAGALGSSVSLAPVTRLSGKATASTNDLFSFAAAGVTLLATVGAITHLRREAGRESPESSDPVSLTDGNPARTLVHTGAGARDGSAGAHILRSRR